MRANHDVMSKQVDKLTTMMSALMKLKGGLDADGEAAASATDGSVLSGLALSCRVASCRAVSCRVVSCGVVSCRVVSWVSQVSFTYNVME